MKKVMLVCLTLALLVAMGGAACVGGAGGPAIGYQAPEGGFQFTATAGFSDPDSQILRIWNAGTGTLRWSVTSDEDWLSLRPDDGRSSGETDDVTVRANIDGMEAGTYEANIVISGSGEVTVPVALTVNEPTVLGPIMAGVQTRTKAEDIGTVFSYRGMAMSLIAGQDIMDMKALELGGTWKLTAIYGEPTANGIPITGGKLESTIGELPAGTIKSGSLMDISAPPLGPIIAGFLGGATLEGVWLVTVNIECGRAFMGMLITDLSGLVEVLPAMLPMLLGMLATNGLGNPGAYAAITIPLEGIMSLLSILMPVMGVVLPYVVPMIEGLLPLLTPIIAPLLGLMPPIMVLMPQAMIMSLLPLLMGMMG